MGKNKKKKAAQADAGEAGEQKEAQPKPLKFKVEKLNQGEGPICPKGSFVVCHYHGTLEDGTVFDSSVNRGEPFKFQVGVGKVIKAWDEGITQLKKGQKAKLTCPPDYAYGEKGAGDVIPPNATLFFEVELIDFYQGIRCSHILLKHAGIDKPYIAHKGNKEVTRTKEEAVESLTKIKESIEKG